MLHIQKFLQSGRSFNLLKDKYAIDVKFHRQYNNLVLFKYNQVDSPFSEQIVRECRGIILDCNQNWKVISMAFTKFFNYGEGHASDIDWNSVNVYEKVDGSLITLYSFDNKWHVATTGTPDAGGNINGFDFTFAELFWKNFPYKLPDVNCNKCFFFELTSQYNKVIVKHTSVNITLLGGRDLVSLQEMTLQNASNFFPGCPTVKAFPLTSFEDIVNTFDKIDPLSQEGYVVVDKYFNRVKCKSPAYVALHHMRDGLASKRSLVKVVLNGEISEVVASFPEYGDILKDISDRFNDLISHLENEYSKISHIENQKEFAMHATKTRCSGALFSVRAKKVNSFRRYIQEMHIDSVIKLLDIKTSEKNISEE